MLALFYGCRLLLHIHHWLLLPSMLQIFFFYYPRPMVACYALRLTWLAILVHASFEAHTVPQIMTSGSTSTCVTNSATALLCLFAMCLLPCFECLALLLYCCCTLFSFTLSILLFLSRIEWLQIALIPICRKFLWPLSSISLLHDYAHKKASEFNS